MELTSLDYAVIAGYIVFALAVGAYFSRRAGRGVEEFFLSGRNLPWWLAGTSLVATTFASDTPLVITGWVRDEGIHMNWIWWCMAIGSVFTVLLFSRYWKRGQVMTSAELAELRYGGKSARVLRLALGIFQSGFTNTIVLSWVILAAAKIQEVVFDIDKWVSIVAASLIALTYCSMAGLWAVVVTDIVQFVMAMIGSIALAWIAWNHVGGIEGVRAAQEAAGSAFTPDTLALFPAHGEGSVFDASFWTVPFATICVFLGVQWWARESADGGPLVVQRVSSAKSERDGMLAVLWYNVAHFALRPWPWILVAVASLILLPPLQVTAPSSGLVTAVGPDWIDLDPSGQRSTVLSAPSTSPSASPDSQEVYESTEQDASEPPIPLGSQRVRFAEFAPDPEWQPTLVQVQPGQFVGRGEVMARSDSERAYVVMMGKYLPEGLLGLAIAALLAAFMSTVDTHVNLASSFFVGDVYRRFLHRNGSERHYVSVARLAGAGVLAIAGLFSYLADSIGDLFTFFLAFTAGVGPVYLARWFWWRVRASTEITAMVSSAVAATWLTFGKNIAGYLEGPAGGVLTRLANVHWELGALAEDGSPTAAGRLVLVLLVSITSSAISVALSPKPDPNSLVPFYERVRPMGAWGPVRALRPDLTPAEKPWPVLVGSLGGSAAILGLLFVMGGYFLDRPNFMVGSAIACVLGTGALLWGMKSMQVATEER